MKKLFIVKNKQSFIQSLPPLTNIKVMTLSELEKKVLGDYNNEARSYLLLDKHMSINLIDVCLSSLKYVDETNYNEKLISLYNLKQELINKGLYFYDEIFLNSLFNYEITFVDFLHNVHLDKIINKLSKYSKVNFNELDVKPLTKQIHEYRFLEDELNDVIYQIMGLLDKGISLNNIKLMNVNKDYYPSLSRILKQYNLPFVSLYNEPIGATNYGLNLINSFKEKGVQETLKLMNNKDYDNAILSVINNYAYLDDIDLALPLIIKDLNDLKIKPNSYDVYLELVDQNYDIKDNDYVFFLGLNNGVAPKINEDNEYLSDDEYHALNELDSSSKTNINERELIACLDKCYYISYKLVGAFDSYLPSYIISKYGLEVVKEENKRHNTYYSSQIETYNYALSRDKYYKTKIKDTNYDYLKYNFSDNIEEKDYSFKGINKEKLREHLNHTLNLSYSKLNDFYSCKFMYYLKYILGINDYKNTLPTIRGNVFHRLLEESDNEDFDYDTIFEDEISRFKETDNKIRFFSSLIKDEYYLVREFNEEFKDTSMLKNSLKEYEVNINKSVEDMDIHIKGFIDKIIFSDQSIALIDYKTGAQTSFHLDLLYYGLNLQLPMYAYYMSYDEKFKNYDVSGLYLQHIYQAFTKKEMLDKDECKKKYKLAGYSNESMLNVLSEDFRTYFVNSNKLPSSMFRQMVKFSEKKVNDAILDIINGSFAINPSYMKNAHDSCKYCQFHDICHFKDKKTILNKQDINDFLGEEVNHE